MPNSLEPRGVIAPPPKIAGFCREFVSVDGAMR
jgi:hypothetical protein